MLASLHHYLTVNKLYPKAVVPTLKESKNRSRTERRPQVHVLQSTTETGSQLSDPPP